MYLDFNNKFINSRFNIQKFKFMKKIILLGVLGMMSLTACSTAKKVEPTLISQSVNFTKLKGIWQVESVEYDSKNFRIKPFAEGVDAQCFVGSEWKLVPNDYSGSYAIKGGGSCIDVQRDIKIDMSGNEFKFKKVFEGTKAKNNTAGYVLTLRNQQENAFSLEQNVGDVKVIYNFVRVSTSTRVKK